MTNSQKIAVRVTALAPQGENLLGVTLTPIGGGPLPGFSGGAHIVVDLPTPDGPRANAYSLTSSPYRLDQYEICVQRAGFSRGGSAFIHDGLKIGDCLAISAPSNLFPRVLRARKHVLIAGGVGITPFLPIAEQLFRENAPFELHYAMRSPAHAAFAERLVAAYPGRVHVYASSLAQKLDLDAVLTHQPAGAHVMVCGPERLIEAVRASAEKCGWPEQAVHFERFASAPAGAPFSIRLGRSGQTIEVGAAQSILEALEAAGLSPDHSCRGGACGRCETAVLSVEGEIAHHDVWLSDTEKAAGRSIVICVSRFSGAALTLDL